MNAVPLETKGLRARAPRARALAAAVVLQLAATAAAIAPNEAGAGPREARQRWKEAQALDRAPWRERLAAFRAVRLETTETDSYFGKAVVAEAGTLIEGGHGSASMAAHALAASIGPRHDPDRFAFVLAAARALLADEDALGARPLLQDVVESGGSTAPLFAGPALELLARLAFDEGDERTLARLSKRAADDVPGRVDVRLAILDRIGVLALDRGERPSAEKTLAEQRRLFDAARREGPEADRVASRAWLRLELPKRLDAR